jgi:ring-1,2-phenylacetyl-CoA epoxidase subunit PaaD
MVTETLTRSLRESLDRVVDPEIPVLTIADLGVLRDVQVSPGGTVEVIITPTYSGCPAMDVIKQDIVTELAADGYDDVRVRVELAPAWTTDWITERGRARLREFGIAPPSPVRRAGPVPVTLSLRPPSVRCPQCDSAATREVSRFGSTSCKAHYVCTACSEPFDYFKEL